MDSSNLTPQVEQATNQTEIFDRKSISRNIIVSPYILFK